MFIDSHYESRTCAPAEHDFSGWYVRPVYVSLPGARRNFIGAHSFASKVVSNCPRRVASQFNIRHYSGVYDKDWALPRALLLKAGELDLLRVEFPEAYGGLGLDKVSSAYVGEKIGIMPSFAGSLGAHTTIGTLPMRTS